MTTNLKSRKVWMLSTMKEAIQERCWDKRVKASPWLATLIQQIIENPEQYEGATVPPAGPDYLSIYIADEKWLEGVEVAAMMHTRLGAMIRVAVARILEEEGIPWDVSTARPRNESIPIRE